MNSCFQYPFEDPWPRGHSKLLQVVFPEFARELSRSAGNDVINKVTILAIRGLLCSHIGKPGISISTSLRPVARFLGRYSRGKHAKLIDFIRYLILCRQARAEADRVAFPWWGQCRQETTGWRLRPGIKVGRFEFRWPAEADAKQEFPRALPGDNWVLILEPEGKTIEITSSLGRWLAGFARQRSTPDVSHPEFEQALRSGLIIEAFPCLQQTDMQRNTSRSS